MAVSYVIVVWSSYVCYVDFFFFKQKTAYEMRISDWSSDVCSSDLPYFGVKIGLPRLMEMMADMWKQVRSWRHEVCSGCRMSSRRWGLTVGDHKGCDQIPF